MAKGKRKADSEEDRPKKQTAKTAKKDSEAEDEQEEVSENEGDEQGGAEAGGLVKPTSRVRQLKGGKPGKGPVIYWSAALAWQPTR